MVKAMSTLISEGKILFTKAVVVGWFCLIHCRNRAQHCGALQCVLSCCLGRGHLDDVVVCSCQHRTAQWPNNLLLKVIRHIWNRDVVLLTCHFVNRWLQYGYSDVALLMYLLKCRNSPCCRMFHQDRCEGVRLLRSQQWICSNPPSVFQTQMQRLWQQRQ